jgi:hypothetical protein
LNHAQICSHNPQPIAWNYRKRIPTQVTDSASKPAMPVVDSRLTQLPWQLSVVSYQHSPNPGPVIGLFYKS